MEPIRPDNDEVAERKGEKPPADRPRPAAARSAVSSTERRGRFSTLPLALVAIVAIAGGWLLREQHQTIQSLQAELGEAQDWINRSKLSMARFEGRLSEADRELLESASDIRKTLEFLDSEMRKLWGVAYDTNRKAIAANQAATEAVEQQVAEQAQVQSTQKEVLATQKAALAAQQEALAAQQSRLAEQAAQLAARAEALAAAERQRQAIAERIDGLAGQQTELAKRIDSRGNAQAELENALAALQERISAVSQQQTLSFDELRARLGAMERKVSSAGDRSAVNALESEVEELKNIVGSIDASRAQFTSRLLRLEERIEGS